MPGDAGAPTALRSMTKSMVCFSSVMWWRTLQTKYLPEWSEPAASSWATVPARRMEPRRLTSVEPVQRTNQPDSIRTDCERRVSSSPSLTVAVSSEVTVVPAKSERPWASSSVRPESLVVPPVPSASLSVKSVCLAIFAEGRRTSHVMSTESTVAAAGVVQA